MVFDPVYGFVFAGLFSPGPNVIMLTASGARFGFRATIPHVLGVAVGVGVTSGVTGLGLGAVLVSQPGLTFGLKLAAAGWILWMAWQLFASVHAPKAKRPDRPFGFWQAVLFQWINPKVWAIAVAATAGFPSGLPPIPEAARLAGIFSSLNLGVCLFWSFSGSLLVYLLKTPRAWGRFTTAMACFLALSAAMVFIMPS
ncbi:MAG: threonine/homoserine/homoserine lactone efflux protein [Paracoccaceae bacterium]|jgi:threonine/homoserine/homoserine lactone efflux protein